MQSLWTVVTYLLKNVEHGTELDVNSAYGECNVLDTSEL